MHVINILLVILKWFFRFSDLFALVEDIDDIKVTKPGRAGGRGKVSGPKNMTKSKQAVMDSETETDSTEVCALVST